MQRLMTAPRSASAALLKFLYWSFLALSCTSVNSVQASEPAQLKSASSHPIQYYLSLPEGWVAGPPERSPRKKWPVVVVIESADRRVSAGCHSLRARDHRLQPHGVSIST